MSKRTQKEVTVAVRMRPDQVKRVVEMAARSELTVERWLYLAIDSAAAVDSAHWEEMARSDEILRELNKDRGRFGRTTVHCRNIGDGAIDSLMGLLVSEREKGREEGAESAKRLAAVRLAGFGRFQRKAGC